MIHVDVVQRRPIHPVSQNSSNHSVAERDQVQRHLILLRLRRGTRVFPNGRSRRKRRRVGLLGRRRVWISAGVLVDDDRRCAAARITYGRIAVRRIAIGRWVPITVVGIIEERVVIVEEWVAVKSAIEERGKTEESVAAKSKATAETATAESTSTEAAESATTSA